MGTNKLLLRDRKRRTDYGITVLEPHCTRGGGLLNGALCTGGGGIHRFLTKKVM